MPMPKLVELYFDPISPYAWLAGRQLERLRAAGAHFDFKPILLAALLSVHGQRGPAEIPAKRDHTVRDVMRTAARLGLPFEGPPTHPFNPLRPLRMCIAVDRPADRECFALALMDAAWARGLDITDDAVLTAIANECTLDASALLASASSPEIKQQLTDATHAAISTGIFGVPTFRYDNELFWGADRIEDLVRRLQGHRIDEAHLAKVLQRPASATRRQRGDN
jgi:2-hydroxychromene-2-carboxylate isomerase